LAQFLDLKLQHLNVVTINSKQRLKQLVAHKLIGS